MTLSTSSVVAVVSLFGPRVYRWFFIDTNNKTTTAQRTQVYGGIPTACHLPNNPDDAVGKVITDVEDKWYDGKYLNHTMNGLDCYPVYMQVGEREM